MMTCFLLIYIIYGGGYISYITHGLCIIYVQIEVQRILESATGRWNNLAYYCYMLKSQLPCCQLLPYQALHHRYVRKDELNIGALEAYLRRHPKHSTSHCNSCIECMPVAIACFWRPNTREHNLQHLQLNHTAGIVRFDNVSCERRSLFTLTVHKFPKVHTTVEHDS